MKVFTDPSYSQTIITLNSLTVDNLNRLLTKILKSDVIRNLERSDLAGYILLTNLQSELSENSRRRNEILANYRSKLRIDPESEEWVCGYNPAGD